MKKILLILFYFLHVTIHSQSIDFIDPKRGKERTAYYPSDCSLILDIKNGKKKLYPIDEEAFSDIVYKCKLYTTGQTLKKSAIEGKDQAISVGKKIYEKSGAKSFIDGLLE